MTQQHFSIIVAHDKQRGIGKNHQIPWKIKEDMDHFRLTTTGHTVIMGRVTWESLMPKFRPLPNRFNIIISHSLVIAPNPPTVKIVPDLEQALRISQELFPNNRIFVIGGASIYSLALKHPACSELIITRLNETYECDVFFPDYESTWEIDKQITKTDLFEIISYKKKKSSKFL